MHLKVNYIILNIDEDGTHEPEAWSKRQNDYISIRSMYQLILVSPQDDQEHDGKQLRYDWLLTGLMVTAWFNKY